MGAMQNNPKETRGKRSKGSRRRGQEAEWKNANPELLYYLIKLITEIGGAILFGRSRDGGAFSIKCWDAEGDWTDYLPGSGDVNEWLHEILNDYSEPK